MTDKELTDILHDKRNELAKVELSIADLKAHKAYLSGQIKTFEKELKRREKWAEKTANNLEVTNKDSTEQTFTFSFPSRLDELRL